MAQQIIIRENSVDTPVITVTDTDRVLFAHDLVDIDRDLIRRLRDTIINKTGKIYSRLYDEWVISGKLEELGVTEIPLSRDSLITLITSRPEYKNRAQRDVLPPQTFTIASNSILGSPVGKVMVYPEVGGVRIITGNVTFSIVNDTQYFVINNRSGMISVGSLINWTDLKTYDLEINITNSDGFSTTAKMTINII